MTILRMIYYMNEPDVALAKDADGNSRPMGTIAGKGTLIPIVFCPLQGGQDRTPIQRCAECKFKKSYDSLFIHCEYNAAQATVEMNPKQESIKQEKRLDSPNIKKKSNRKEPDGVFKV